jgi:hypothetical protein
MAFTVNHVFNTSRLDWLTRSGCVDDYHVIAGVVKVQPDCIILTLPCKAVAGGGIDTRDWQRSGADVVFADNASLTFRVKIPRVCQTLGISTAQSWTQSSVMVYNFCSGVSSHAPIGWSDGQLASSDGSQ